MKPLAIIPARAGSRRLPGKNLMKIAGLNLIEHAIVAAHVSDQFGDRILVTTDIEGKFWGEHCPWFTHLARPPYLCRPETQMAQVVRHAANWAMTNRWPEFDSIVLLQPTSPLRLASDIAACVALLETSDAVISVTDGDIPELFTLGHAGRMRPLPLGQLADGRKVVQPNGAVFAAKRHVFDHGHDWWTADVVTAYPMPPERSVDIDTIVDFEEAKAIYERPEK